LVVVYTEAAEILLLRRHSPFDFWQSVTGSLHENEAPADAARRELQEESGLIEEGEFHDAGISRHFVIDPRWRDQYPQGVTENVEHEWQYRLPAKPEIRINPGEHSEYCWMSLSDAVDTVWSWTNKEALRNLQVNPS
jgi:dATP pyrophosphohydrolase